MTQRIQEPAAAVFGGRRFTSVPPAELSVGQELRYMQLYAKSGLGDLTLQEGEDPRAFALRIVDELTAAGIVLEMLGSLLLPEDKEPKDWTPEMGKATAAFLSSLTGEENRAAVRAHVLTLVLDFFEAGLISFWSSRRSSAGTATQPLPERSQAIPSVH